MYYRMPSRGDGRKLHGCALLTKEPAAEREAMKRQYGLQWSET
jgi:hypothetical protein